MRLIWRVDVGEDADHRGAVARPLMGSRRTVQRIRIGWKVTEKRRQSCITRRIGFEQRAERKLGERVGLDAHDQPFKRLISSRKVAARS